MLRHDHKDYGLITSQAMAFSTTTGHLISSGTSRSGLCSNRFRYARALPSLIPAASPGRRRRSSICMRSRRAADPVVVVPDKVFLAQGLKTADRKPYDCSDLKGKVVLALNVASLDDRADEYYKKLVEWHDKYKDRGLEILAFPNNWYFGQEEPWPVEEVKEHVQKKYGVKFTVMDKSDIDANPILKVGFKPSLSTLRFFRVKISFPAPFHNPGIIFACFSS